METSELFRKTLKKLLQYMPRGKQSRIADELGIERRYMNDFLNGRKMLSESKREEIAKNFGWTYIDFLVLGRGIFKEEYDAELERKNLIKERQRNQLEMERFKQAISEHGIDIDDDKVDIAFRGMKMFTKEADDKDQTIPEYHTPDTFGFALIVEMFERTISAILDPVILSNEIRAKAIINMYNSFRRGKEYNVNPKIIKALAKSIDEIEFIGKITPFEECYSKADFRSSLELKSFLIAVSFLEHNKIIERLEASLDKDVPLNKENVEEKIIDITQRFKRAA